MDAPPERSAELTRVAILEAAAEVFARQGFARASLRAIAAEAGVTKSLIHHHFGSKESLWKAVLARPFAAYAQLQHEILERPDLGPADLEDSLSAFFDFLAAHLPFVRLHGWANAGDGGGFVESGDLRARGVERLAALQKSGRLRADVDPAAVLVACFALTEHWFQARASLQDRFGESLPDDRSYLDSIRRILIRGIQP